MFTKPDSIQTGDVYHIFNRGVDKREVFLDKSDYLRFYKSLYLFNKIEPIVNFDTADINKNKLDPTKRLVDIVAYSLLPNHFHLIVKQLVDGGISEFMKRLSGGYTNYFNNKLDRTGVLFQGKFKRVIVESEEQNQYLFAYVNENHFVHNIEIEREIFHSSSLHYQNIYKSKIITNVVVNYKYIDNVLLAEEIYERRKGTKKSNLLE